MPSVLFTQGWKYKKPQTGSKDSKNVTSNNIDVTLSTDSVTENSDMPPMLDIDSNLSNHERVLNELDYKREYFSKISIRKKKSNQNCSSTWACRLSQSSLVLFSQVLWRRTQHNDWKFSSTTL